MPDKRRFDLKYLMQVFMLHTCRSAWLLQRSTDSAGARM